MADPIPDSNNVRIAALLPEHARAVAALHIYGIKTGFISSLGGEFVTTLYRAIAASRYGFGLVAKSEGKIIGFIAFTTDLTGLYKSVILRHGLRFIFLLAGKMRSLKWLRNVFETIFYPQRIRKISSLHTALLSIVVATEERGKGLASEMIRKGFLECRRRGIDEVRVLVGADNKPANALYPKCGFKLVGQIKNHGVLSNVYEAQTEHFEHH